MAAPTGRIFLSPLYKTAYECDDGIMMPRASKERWLPPDTAEVWINIGGDGHQGNYVVPPYASLLEDVCSKEEYLRLVEGACEEGRQHSVSRRVYYICVTIMVLTLMVLGCIFWYLLHKRDSAAQKVKAKVEKELAASWRGNSTVRVVCDKWENDMRYKDELFDRERDHLGIDSKGEPYKYGYSTGGGGYSTKYLWPPPNVSIVLTVSRGGDSLRARWPTEPAGATVIGNAR